MSLPKIDKPVYSLKIPSTGKEVSYRPFLVKEEKLLLMAAQGKDDKEIVRAIKQIINNCVVDTSFNVNDLATFDIEYFFIKLRSKSVGNIIKIQITDPELEKPISKDLDLDTVVIKDLKKPPVIKLSDTMSMQMKYPKVDFSEKVNMADNSGFAENLTEIIGYLIDKIYDGDEVYVATDYSEKEILEFAENLPVSVITQVEEFIDTMPKVYCEVFYDMNGEKRKVELDSLQDFFILG